MAHDPLYWASRFNQARGVSDDGQWAGRVMICFARNGLAAEPARAALGEALGAVRESQESPRDLFGDPDDWAANRLAEASLGGDDFVADRSSINTLAVVAFTLAGVMYLIFLLLALVKEGLHTKWTVGAGIAPLVMAVTAVGAMALREHLVRNRPSSHAGALALAAAAPGVALTAWLFLSSASRPTSTFVWLAEAVMALGLAWLAGRVLPGEDERTIRASGDAAISDEQWIEEFSAALRDRGDISETQVRARLDDVRDHVAASGTTLCEEFGNPLGYASALPGDPSTRTRRSALAWTALFAFWVVLVWTDSPAEIGWWRLGFVIFVATMAGHGWWRHLQARRSNLHTTHINPRQGAGR